MYFFTEALAEFLHANVKSMKLHIKPYYTTNEIFIEAVAKSLELYVPSRPDLVKT